MTHRYVDAQLVNPSAGQAVVFVRGAFTPDNMRVYRNPSPASLWRLGQVTHSMQMRGLGTVRPRTTAGVHGYVYSDR